MIHWRIISIFIVIILLTTSCKNQNNKISVDLLSSSKTEATGYEQNNQADRSSKTEYRRLLNETREQELSSNSSLHHNTIQEEINSYMNGFISLNTSHSIVTEVYDIPFAQNAEGGELKRYSINDVVIRYKITYYGETGKKEENYYLLNDYMYCTSLTEMYGGSIIQTDAEILYREFDEGIMIGKDCYQYNTDMESYVMVENDRGFFNEEELQSEFYRLQ